MAKIVKKQKRTMRPIPDDQHNIEIQKNAEYWKSKPVLRKVYQGFYKLIAQHIRDDIRGKIVEIGSGIGNLKTVIPECLCTDIFPNPWIDQVENAYSLSFIDKSVSNLILFDVWHHLEYGGTALQEFYRVLVRGGRLILFEPAVSLLGFIVYGIFHHEPIKYFSEIKWWAPGDFSFKNAGYYAAQGNASRVFLSRKYKKLFSDWEPIIIKRIASLSYAASGGYRGRQLYPASLYNFVTLLDKICSYIPQLFATRLLVVLEKR